MKTGFAGREMLSVVDLGQSKFVVLVAEMVSDHNYSVVGYGESVAAGIQKGKVINIDEMVEALGRAVKKAEVMSHSKIESMYVGISGHFVRGCTHGAATYISGDTVVQRDVDQVMQTAQAHELVDGEERILHVLEQCFAINHRNGIRKPLGMEGVLLEGNAHVISVDANVVANIERCFHSAGFPPLRIMSNHLASASAVLTQAEKDLGTILIDFGAGVCDIAVFQSGVLSHIHAVDHAGDEIDSDIAKTYRISVAEAERRKREKGSATEAGAESGAGHGEEAREANILSMVIQSRAEDIMGRINKYIKECDFGANISGGVVLTGGGGRLANIERLASEVIALPVRIGFPTYAGEHADMLNGPEYASALGLVEMCKGMASPVPRRGNGLVSRAKTVMNNMFQID